MKKNGFTLVELLAVIVVLGIIMAIASSSLMKARKEANIKEAEQIEKSIMDIAPEVYMDSEEEYNGLGNNGLLEFNLEKLTETGYLKSNVIKNPTGSGNCTGKLSIKKTNDGPVFDTCLYCPGIEGFENECN